MTQTQVKPLKYDDSVSLPPTTWDEEAKIALEAYAKTQRWGSFARSLLSQQGRWSEKQRKWVNSFIQNYAYTRREQRNAEWRDLCVRKWIAEVGAAAAAAHAAELLKDADDLDRRAEQGEYNCESHTKWTRRAWDGYRNAAATAREKAKHISRILDTMNNGN